MEKEFIPYQQALALKELGFDEPCFGYFENQDMNLVINFNNLPLTEEQSKRPGLYTIDNRNSVLPQWATATPLYQQAFRWFREKYNLRGFIGFRPNVKQFDCHIYDMSLSGKEYVKQRTMEEYNKDPKVGTYEEAELECLKKLIDIVKQK
jgi:hypothetical protein